MRRDSNASRRVDKNQPPQRGGRRPKGSVPTKPVPWCRDIIAGPEVKLLKISRAGALVESDSRLCTGLHICLRLNAGDTTFLLKGRVLRSKSSVPDGCASRYESAVVFDEDFVLHHEDVPEPNKPARGSRPRAAREPAAGCPAPFYMPAGETGLPPAILSETLVSGQTGSDLRRILGIL